MSKTKGLLKLNNTETNSTIEKRKKSLNRYLIKKHAQMVNKHTERWQRSFVIRELQMKAMKAIPHLLEWIECKELTISVAGKSPATLER